MWHSQDRIPWWMLPDWVTCVIQRQGRHLRLVLLRDWLFCWCIKKQVAIVLCSQKFMVTKCQINRWKAWVSGYSHCSIPGTELNAYIPVSRVHKVKPEAQNSHSSCLIYRREKSWMSMGWNICVKTVGMTINPCCSSSALRTPLSL